MARKSKKGKLANLTSQQEAFCQRYVLHHNGADAYGHAYPVSKRKDAQYRAKKAHELLCKVEIRGRIEQLSTKVAEVVEKKFQVTAESLIQEMAALAYFNPADYFEWGMETVTRIRRDGTEYTVNQPFMRFKPSSDLSKIQIKAIAGVEQTVSKTGDLVLNVKLAEKRAAIKDLHTMAGFAKPTEVSGVGGSPLQIVISRAEEAL